MLYAKSHDCIVHMRGEKPSNTEAYLSKILVQPNIISTTLGIQEKFPFEIFYKPLNITKLFLNFWLSVVKAKATEGENIITFSIY